MRHNGTCVIDERYVENDNSDYGLSLYENGEEGLPGESGTSILSGFRHVRATINQPCASRVRFMCDDVLFSFIFSLRNVNARVASVVSLIKLIVS